MLYSWCVSVKGVRIRIFVLFCVLRITLYSGVAALFTLILYSWSENVHVCACVCVVTMCVCRWYIHSVAECTNNNTLLSVCLSLYRCVCVATVWAEWCGLGCSCYSHTQLSRLDNTQVGFTYSIYLCGINLKECWLLDELRGYRFLLIMSGNRSYTRNPEFGGISSPFTTCQVSRSNLILSNACILCVIYTNAFLY